MRILYLTTSMRDEDFSFLLKHESEKPNPSNQNFHSKLIKTLKNHDLEVISAIPVVSKAKFIDSSDYHYINCYGKWDKLFFPRHREIYEKALSLYANKEKPEIIIFDSLSVACGKAAAKLKKKWGTKAIAVITDNPYNLSYAPAKYIRLVFDNAEKVDGAIALTKELGEVFKVDLKHTLIIHGLVEQTQECEKGNYIYFGGALYERYGVADLIDGFIEAKKDIELRIAGHGELASSIEELSKIHANITYLGQISKEENYKQEAGAALLINPRRFDAALDKESVPSKMFEYLANGEVVASTKNSILENLYGDSINWVEGGSPEAWARFFSDHIDDGHVVGLKPNQAKEKIQSEYGLDSVTSKIDEFLLAA